MLTGNILYENELNKLSIEHSRILDQLKYNDYYMNVIDHGTEFMNDLKEVSSKIIDRNDKESREFIKVMSQFEKLFTKKVVRLMLNPIV